MNHRRAWELLRPGCRKRYRGHLAASFDRYFSPSGTDDFGAVRPDDECRSSLCRGPRILLQGRWIEHFKTAEEVYIMPESLEALEI